MANQSFKEAYAVLQQHAQALRDQQAPDVDALLTIVAESAQAYQVCRERIDAVEKLLEKASPVTPASAQAPQRAVWTPSPKAAEPVDLDDQEVPFFRLLLQPKFQAAINRLN